MGKVTTQELTTIAKTLIKMTKKYNHSLSNKYVMRQRAVVKHEFIMLTLSKTIETAFPSFFGERVPDATKLQQGDLSKLVRARPRARAPTAPAHVPPSSALGRVSTGANDQAAARDPAAAL